MDPMHSALIFSFDRPAVYRISVEGRLEASWSDRLAGMAVNPGTSAEGPPTTTLVGELSDQASLAGILKTLYDLHRSVLLVERLSTGEKAADRAEP
jgi:hypothetical protein